LRVSGGEGAVKVKVDGLEKGQVEFEVAGNDVK
jgi:hypothetical protein